MVTNGQIAGSLRRFKTGLRLTADVVTNARGQRARMLRNRTFPMLSRVTPSLAVERDGMWFYVSTADQQVGRDIYVHGASDQRVMAKAVELIGEALGTNPLLDRMFLDIGANIGTSTITALKRFGATDAIAAEPEPGNRKLFRCNLVMNELEDRVTILPYALSDHDGTATLELSNSNWGDHRVRVDAVAQGHFDEQDRRTIDVRVVRFDDLAAEIDLDLSRVGLVWIDTQGHEGHVLSGASLLLESHIPIVMEYWPYGLGRAGGMADLRRLIETKFREIVDLRASLHRNRRMSYSADRIGDLESIYTGVAHTDLLLLK